MEDDKLTVAAKDQLQLVLSFFPRVESKSSVILAIDTAMIAFLASTAPPFSAFSKWLWLLSATAIGLLSLSILMLYLGGFPNLKGGESSLTYFSEIAKQREQKFIVDFSSQTQKAYADDLLGQAWRNSQILSKKFNSLKIAFVFMALAMVPWLIALALSAAYYGGFQPVPLKP